MKIHVDKGNILHILVGMKLKTLCELIEKCAVHKGLSPSTIGRVVGVSGDFYKRIKSGKHDLTTKRLERVLQKLSDNWPADLDWPRDIPRPTPAADSPAIISILEARARNPLTKLNDRDIIADTDAFCTKLHVERSQFDQVIAHYADGKPKADLRPRAGSSTDLIFQHLLDAGDARFVHRLEQLKLLDQKIAATIGGIPQ